MLELIGFIAILYLAIKYLPDLLMFVLKLAVILLLIVLAIGAFEFICYYIYFRI
jgi:hypothetical protein